MENIITQAATPGSMARQAKGPAPTPGTGNDAKGFTTEMDNAVKKSIDSSANDANAAERGDNLEINNSNENPIDDMKGTDTSGSAAAGLLIAPTEAPEEVAGLCALTVPSKSVGYLEGQPGEGVQAVAVVEGAQSTETISTEDKSMKSLNDSALNRNSIEPQKLSEAKVVPDDAKGTMEALENGKERIDTAKAFVHDKFIKGEFAAPASTQLAGASDEAPDLPDAKTAGAAAVLPEQSSDSSGAGHGDANAGKKGQYNHAEHRGAEAAGISQASRQSVSFETVVTGGELSGSERAEIYEKLSTGVSMSIAKDGGEVKLSLRPDHLGNLNIKLNIEDGKVNARIVVESAAVKEALEADNGTLREVFAKNNLVLEKYTVEITSSDFSNENNLSDFSGYSGFNGDTSKGFLSFNDSASDAMEDLNAADAVTAGNSVSGIDLFI